MYVCIMNVCKYVCMYVCVCIMYVCAVSSVGLQMNDTVCISILYNKLCMYVCKYVMWLSFTCK